MTFLIFDAITSKMSDQIPTLKAIAEKLNFSVSTVSRALSNHPRIGLRTKELVQKTAKELGYEPNPKAIFLNNRKVLSLV